MSEPGRTEVSRIVDASPGAVYRAFLDPAALAQWLPPGEMTAIVHAFDAREGGVFSMSLVYPESETVARGKTSENTDTFRGRFARLIPSELVVWAVEFQSADPAFAGEMTVSAIFAPLSGGRTRITMLCENIPSGINPEDNEAGSRSTLEKLAAYLAPAR